MRVPRYLLLPALTAAVVTTGGALAPAANAQADPVAPTYVCEYVEADLPLVHGAQCRAENGAPEQGPFNNAAITSSDGGESYLCELGFALTPNGVQGMNCSPASPGQLTVQAPEQPQAPQQPQTPGSLFPGLPGI